MVKHGLITPGQLNQAKEETLRTGLTVEKALEKLGFITEEDIAHLRAQVFGVPYIDLAHYLIDAHLIKLVPGNLAQRYKVVPVLKAGNSLTVAMLDPRNIEVLDKLRKVTGLESIEPVLASEKGIQKILDSHYGTIGSVQEIAKSLDEQISSESAGAEDQEKALSAAEDAPVIKLVNVLIMQALKDGASDIHVEPEEEVLRIRCRIDGILHEIDTLPKKLHKSITSRIKVLAGMDIAENRKPQDGRICLSVKERDVDIRVSTFPTLHGENTVLRLLDRAAILPGLQDLGFAQDALMTFEKLIKRPEGIILVSGPTGSGKTTTLYSALTTINSMQKNIITIEDPVEYELPLIRQTPVNAASGITFANGLRSILRQDPDIIMVGEIRDKETAAIAIQAALTGHLVFSTLHTNDAAGALTRLMDMGIEPFLLSSSVIAILAQRLVRKVCDECRQKYQPEDAVLHNLKMEKGVEFYRGKGCPRCKQTGFLGRSGIFELLVVDEHVRKLIDSGASAEQIKKLAQASGMRTLREAGLNKAKQGLTSVEEVFRVTAVEE